MSATAGRGTDPPNFLALNVVPSFLTTFGIVVVKQASFQPTSESVTPPLLPESAAATPVCRLN